MIPNDGNLFSKTIYFSNIMVKVGDGTLLLWLTLALLFCPLDTDLLHLKLSYMFLNFSIIYFLLDNGVRITIVMWRLTLPLLVSRTTPRVMSLL